jgi:hypothetical protein
MLDNQSLTRSPGGIGIRCGLKPRCREACGFESHGEYSPECRGTELGLTYQVGKAILDTTSGYGGTGRRPGLRIQCRETCRFDSCYPHGESQDERGRTLVRIQPN